MDILDFLTPEEREVYSKKIVPSTGDRIGMGVSGLADAITSVGKRPTNYYGDFKKDLGENLEGAQKEMYALGGDRRKQMLDEFARNKLEGERTAVIDTASQDYPDYFDEDLSGKDTLEFWKNKKAGELGLEKTKMMANRPRGGRGRDMSYWWTAQRKGALADNRVAPLHKQGVGLKEAQTLLNAVKAGNSVAYAGLGIKMAKGMGEVGVMTENDIKRYVQSGKMSQKAGDKLKTWVAGVPSEATQQEIQEILNVVAAEYQQKVLPVYDEWINSAGAISKSRGENMSRQQVMDMLALEGSTVEADPGQPQGLTPEEEEELNQLESQFGGE